MGAVTADAAGGETGACARADVAVTPAKAAAKRDRRVQADKFNMIANSPNSAL